MVLVVQMNQLARLNKLQLFQLDNRNKLSQDETLRSYLILLMVVTLLELQLTLLKGDGCLKDRARTLTAQTTMGHRC